MNVLRLEVYKCTFTLYSELTLFIRLRAKTLPRISFMLKARRKEVGESKYLHIIDIKDVDNDFKELMDKHLILICEGESDSEVKLVKSRLINFLEKKTEETKMGAIAELLVHLYLNGLSFKQEFLFFNLEENSIKKGFDGLFSKGGDTYLVESKSGSFLSNSISHSGKLKEAYKDLSKYVSGESEKGRNNPWKNAYNHASHCDVATKNTIRKKIKALRDMYDQGRYAQIENFHVIPCSTIYLNSKWCEKCQGEIVENPLFIQKFSGLSVNAVCITKASLYDFIEYLGE